MLADNLFNATGVSCAQGNFPEASEFFQKGLKVSRSIGSVHLEVVGLLASVQVHMNSGDIDQALLAVEAGIEKLVRLSTLVSSPRLFIQQPVLFTVSLV